MASCPNRQQGEPCSLPWPSELWIHSTQLLTIIYRERESSFIARNKKYCTKGKNQFGPTERHFLPVFTSWLVFTILGTVIFFVVVVYILVYIYISTPSLTFPSVSFFSCDLRTITWPFFPLSPLPACPSPLLLITAYLEAPDAW